VPLPTVYNVAVSDQTTESKAVFGQATYSVTPSVRVIGGVRYSSETVSGVVQNGTNTVSAQPAVLAGFTITVPGLKVSRTNWKAGIEADIGPSSMFYATASSGFKAGGYSQYTQLCGGKSFGEHKPEDITAYSTGLRSRFLGGAVQVNMEGFVWKYENQQVATQQALACTTGLSNQRFILNAGKATIQGANIDVIVRPITDGAFHFFAEYADGKYDSFVLPGLPTAGSYLAARGSRCTTTGAGPVSVDCGGLPLSRLPKWSVAMDYQHTFHLGNGGMIRPKVDMQYASSRYADVVYGPNGKLPSYTQFNGQIAYKAPENSWEFTAYVRNITNAKVYTGGLSTTTAATAAGFGTGANTANIYSVTINPPRQFGVRATKNF
jgi:iron complex outermembrane recepter protein